MKRSLHTAMVLIWVVALGTEARAESVDQASVAEAERHFERGIELVQREQWGDALAAFEDSMRIFPTQTTLFNRALCLRLLDRATDAVTAFEEILDRYGTEIEASRQAEIQRELTNLRSRVGRIAVRAGEIRGAAVVVDGAEVGRTPLSRPVVVTPGSHNVEVRAEGFETFNQQISVTGGAVQTVEVSLRRAANPGRIRVNLALPGAQITVDGRQVGTTPLSEPVPAQPGDRTVSASRSGYQTAQIVVQVAEGREAVATLLMVPSPDLPPEMMGILDVQVSESGAEVLLDGAPLREDAVPIGPHHLEVRREGFETFTRDFEVGRGATTLIEADLVPAAGEAPIDVGGSRRGTRIAAYLMTGLAVVALGVGVGLAAWNGGRFDDWETEDAALRLAYSSTESEPADEAVLWGRVGNNDSLADSIRAVDGVAWVFLGTGIASALTAVVLYIVGFRSGGNESNEDVQVSLSPRPGGLTLGASWNTW